MKALAMQLESVEDVIDKLIENNPAEEEKVVVVRDAFEEDEEE